MSRNPFRARHFSNDGSVPSPTFGQERSEIGSVCIELTRLTEI